MSATCRTHIQAGMPSGNSLHSIVSLVPPQQPPFFFAAKLLNTYIIKQKKILFGIALTSWVVKCLVFLKYINVPSCVACGALSIHPQLACRCKQQPNFWWWLLKHSTQQLLRAYCPNKYSVVRMLLWAMSSLRYRVLFSIRKSCFSTVDPFLSLMSELKKKKPPRWKRAVASACCLQAVFPQPPLSFDYAVASGICYILCEVQICQCPPLPLPHVVTASRECPPPAQVVAARPMLMASSKHQVLNT